MAAEQTTESVANQNVMLIIGQLVIEKCVLQAEIADLKAQLAVVQSDKKSQEAAAGVS